MKCLKEFDYRKEGGCFATAFKEGKSLDQTITGIYAADALLEALQEAGVSYLFSNLGSDHPAIIEALAKAKAENKELPQVIISPHEYVALSAAHGVYLQNGEAQGVFIHTDVGTQNMGGSLHNAFRSRIPVFIFAGETPYTMEGELRGSRNSHINYLQNVYDQRGIVRNYVKWEQDIRTAVNIKQLTYRAMQLAKSDPKGPVYLTGAREVLEEAVKTPPVGYKPLKPIEESTLPSSGVRKIIQALTNAIHPVLITSYIGRKVEAVDQLTELCETFAIPVIEVNPTHMNFSANHPLHAGFEPGKLLEEADVVLVIDSDVPWIPSIAEPNEKSQVFYIDVDPIKESIPLWPVEAESFFKADSYQALLQLNEFARSVSIDQHLVNKRYELIENLHLKQRKQWREKEEIQIQENRITPEFLTACLRRVIDEAIVLNETITNAAIVSKHLPRTLPGTLFGNGGSSLGWSGGAALGVKLAAPDKTVVCLTGDASYLFSVPSSVHWMSRRYHAPFLTVIYNNQGWNATKNNYLKLYPDGYAKKDDRYWVNFDQPADLSKIAEAAGGAYARQVNEPRELEEALRSGLAAVQAGQSAVIDVKIPQISQQRD